MNLIRPEQEELAIIGIAVAGRASDLKHLMQLTPGDFCDSRARTLFEGLQALMLRQEKLSLQTLDEELTRSLGAELTGELMSAAMAAAMENSFNGWSLPNLVQTVSEAAQRRHLIKTGEALSRAAADEQRDVAEVMEAAQASLQKNVRSDRRIVNLTTACLESYNAIYNQDKPIPTGIEELDQALCGGLHRGELTILGARPAVGKSSVLLEIARTAARAGKKVLFVSLEMSTQQTGLRVLAANSGLNTGKLRSGSELQANEQSELADGLTEVGTDGSENISILAVSGATIEELTQTVQAGEYDLLVVDYIQLLRTRQKTGSDFERLGVVSRGLKGITLSANLPVIAAAQVKRQNNGGVLRAPGLDELRGSGDLEQDADNVLLLHRVDNPDDYVLGSPGYLSIHAGLFEAAQARKCQLLTIEVAKQRQGKTCRTWAMFNPSRMKFYNPGVYPA